METKNVVERTEQSEPSSTEAIASEKKEDEAVTPKEEKVSAKPEEKAPRIESQASSQEKPLKEDAKAVTNEEVKTSRKMFALLLMASTWILKFMSMVS
ncbi:beta-galactosidase [Streptococcus pneumoniae]|nr:beta-galactosidase [Streptococcus pneumoniae]